MYSMLYKKDVREKKDQFKTGNHYSCTLFFGFLFLCLRASDSRSQRHHVLGLSVHPSVHLFVCPILVNVFQEHLEGISSDLAQVSPWIQR